MIPGNHPLAGRVSLPSAMRTTRVLLYGVDGIGKTTFAKEAPDPIFLCAEPSMLPPEIPGIVPSSWVDAYQIVQSLQKDAFGRRTFVVDTVDWLYPKAVYYVCSRDNDAARGKLILPDGQPYLEGYGYGRGPSIVAQAWMVFLDALNELRLKQNMNIILLAHAGRIRVKNPGGDDFDMIGPKLDRDTADLVCQWPDAVLYAEFYREQVVETDEKRKPGKSKMISTGARICWTQNKLAHRAKNRDGMPEVIRLSWAEYAKYALADLGQLRAEIEKSLTLIGDPELSTTVRNYIASERSESAPLILTIERLNERLKTMRHSNV